MFRILTATAAALTLGTGMALAATWDTNDDGMVDAEEFAKGNASSATFDRFDDDGNGAVTFEEVGLSEADEVFSPPTMTATAPSRRASPARRPSCPMT